MKDYKHFVIIRFNIRANFDCKLRDMGRNPMKEILDEAYLKERFALFETYTLPSLKKQTCQNFKTIILFHRSTPKEYKKKISQLQKEYPFEALFLGDGESFSFENFVREIYKEKYKYYITSRLDNDDMYAETYIEKIQEYADNQQELSTCILSFSRGEKYDLRMGYRYEFNYKQNHFLTMIGTAREDIYQYNHAVVESSGYEIIVLEPDTVMWTEIIHESNVANEVTSLCKNQNIILKLERMEWDEKIMKESCLAIYGVGDVGKAVYEKIKNRCRVICFIDEYANIQDYDGIAVLRISDLYQIEDIHSIIIAVSYDYTIIKDKLLKQLKSEIEIKDICDLCKVKKSNANLN